MPFEIPFLEDPMKRGFWNIDIARQDLKIHPVLQGRCADFGLYIGTVVLDSTTIVSLSILEEYIGILIAVMVNLPMVHLL